MMFALRPEEKLTILAMGSFLHKPCAKSSGLNLIVLLSKISLSGGLYVSLCNF